MSQIYTNDTSRSEDSIRTEQGKQSRISIEPQVSVFGNIKPVAEMMPAEKMTVQAFHLRGSKAKCASPSEFHEVEQRNFQMSNTRRSISLTISCNHRIPSVDQSGCARHDVLYATARSNRCQVGDRQHVEAISRNARQVFEDHVYQFFRCPAAKQTTDVVILNH